MRKSNRESRNCRFGDLTGLSSEKRNITAQRSLLKYLERLYIDSEIGKEPFRMDARAILVDTSPS